MAYASELEARIAKKVTRAIVEHKLIEDGDRVMVGLSGGKDSWTLMHMLDQLRRRAPIRFSLVAVNVDSGYKEYKHDLIARTCEERGWELKIEHTSIGDVMDDILADGATPCSLCARLRRGVLYRLADEVGATRIALGHHADDFIETLLLNLFFAGALKAMPARLVSDNGRHVVIRPLAYVFESEARQYTKDCGLPIVGCCCPACGDLSLQRQRVKRLLHDLELEYPDIKNSMLKALGNVHARHLLRRGSAPDPGSVARGDPEAPLRALAGAPCAPSAEGSAPDPGSVARGDPEAPLRALAGAPCAPSAEGPAADPGSVARALQPGSERPEQGRAGADPEAPLRFIASALSARPQEGKTGTIP